MAAQLYGKFTKTIDGTRYQRTAYSAAQAVRLRFDGWVEVPAKKMPRPGPPADPGTQTT